MFKKNIKGFRIENYHKGKPPEKDVLVSDFCKCNIHQFKDKYKVFLTRIDGIEEITSITTFDSIKKAVNFVRKMTINNFFGYN
jgi:hypothetical protein